MVQHCKGICRRFKGFRSARGQSLYKNGVIVCKLCDCGFEYHGVYCPCCKTKVRHNSRSSYTRRVKVETVARIS